MCIVSISTLDYYRRSVLALMRLTILILTETVNGECECCYCKVARVPSHQSDDGAVYTCQMTLTDMVLQCNLTLNVTCTYYFAT